MNYVCLAESQKVRRTDPLVSCITKLYKEARTDVTSVSDVIMNKQDCELRVLPVDDRARI